MTKLAWLWFWMFPDESESPSQEELAWRAAWVRRTKWTAFVICASYAVWEFGRFEARRAVQKTETFGQVVWKGDASYSTGTFRPGSSIPGVRVGRDGVRVLVDGDPEPLLYTTAYNPVFATLSIGERVQVTYSFGRWLFWEEKSITKLSKLSSVDSPGRRMP